MARPPLPRLLAALLLLGGGGAAAVLGGIAPAAAAGLLLVGALAFLVLAPLGRPEAVAPTPPPATKPQRPGARDLLETFPEPVLIVRDRRVALANGAARAVLGAGIEGEDVRLAIRHPLAAERLVDPGAGADAAAPAELVGLGQAGRRWTMTIARLADGARLVRLEDRSASHATEKMRADFVANASHELRTPLATLLGFIETLEDLNEGPGEETRARFLGIMGGEARRMSRLVDDLISLSRIEAERFTVPQDAHDLLTLVEQAREDQRHLVAARGSAVVIDAPDDLPAVAGDRPQLLQMIDNLLANALKYGRPGAPVRVSVRADGSVDGRGALVLRVADEGEGIAREHLPRLTERFYRVDAGRSRAAGGTGLGLAIVKHVVERHRGRLSFDSEVGRGTTVTVALPAVPRREVLSSNGHVAVTMLDTNGDSDAATPS